MSIRRAHGGHIPVAPSCASRESTWGGRQRRALKESPMTKQTVKSIVARVALMSACVLYVAGCAGSVELGPDAVRGQTPDGTVEMHEVQAAYIGSGSSGTGVLFFRGVEYPFEVGGVGVGGFGLSTV